MSDVVEAEYVDVLILGAGLSGIAMASRLDIDKTGLSFAVIERRQRVGGTWDLFRYPGVRSDSDMYTFGYGFRSWRGSQLFASGEAIRDYVETTARDNGVLDRIYFGRRAVRAAWSSETRTWRVEVVDEDKDERQIFACRFLSACMGYYDYDQGHRPELPGEANFRGTWVHPQHWPADLDYRRKHVVVIGSGATAVTVVPALAVDAAHVTMLQRSPSYIIPVPGRDLIAALLLRLGLPAALVSALGRPRLILVQSALYGFARHAPIVIKVLIRALNRRHLDGSADLAHFTPTYEPSDQRLCFAPDGDLFRVMKTGKASVVTDVIDTFVSDAVITKSGNRIPADIVVTATGLALKALGGMDLVVDGESVEVGQRLLYKGALLEDVPNFVMVLGYVSMSWTLKSDLVAKYFTRIANHMNRNSHATFVASAGQDDRTGRTVFESALKAGYVRRSPSAMPLQGHRRPWETLQNYLLDNAVMRYSPIDDGILQFDRSVGSGRVSSRSFAAPARRIAQRIRVARARARGRYSVVGKWEEST